jgi:hypothetical protein
VLKIKNSAKLLFLFLMNKNVMDAKISKNIVPFNNLLLGGKNLSPKMSEK